MKSMGGLNQGYVSPCKSFATEPIPDQNPGDDAPPVDAAESEREDPEPPQNEEENEEQPHRHVSASALHTSSTVSTFAQQIILALLVIIF